MKIRAAVVYSVGGPFEIEDVELAKPRADEVLVRIAGVGVCHTDLVCRDQYIPVPLPCVFGHEGAGIVEEIGTSVTKVAVGDHVVLSFNSCKTCPSCLAGSPAYCHELYERNFLGARADGSSALSKDQERLSGHFFSQSSFGTFAVASERNTIRVDHDVPLWLLGPLGCGVQTGAGAVMNSLRIEAGSTLAIFGGGTVGLSAVIAARLSGCSEIILIEPVEARRALSIELGATRAIDPTAEDPIEAIRAITGGGCMYTLECTGLPAVVRQAVESLQLRGVCGVMGLSPFGTEVSLDMNSILFGRSVRGIIEGDSTPDEFIPRLVGLFKRGLFPFDRLITGFEFDDIQKAVDASEGGHVVKAVLTMDKTFSISPAHLG